MPTLDAAPRLAADMLTVASESALADILAEACGVLGCSWFALSHHIDFLAAPEKGIRVHNYPEEWARRFDEQGLGLSDPVHRACKRRAAGFLWREMRRFSPPRAGDDDVLAEARLHDIDDGLTIPVHVPGEAHGSVSFAWRRGDAASFEALMFAQTIGAPVFEAARLIANPHLVHIGPRLTDRQRECLIWSAKGYSIPKVGRILDLSPNTVHEHLRNARQRYGANGGITLTVRALYGGDLSFEDIARR